MSAVKPLYFNHFSSNCSNFYLPNYSSSIPAIRDEIMISIRLGLHIFIGGGGVGGGDY